MGIKEFRPISKIFSGIFLLTSLNFCPGIRSVGKNSNPFLETPVGLLKLQYLMQYYALIQNELSGPSDWIYLIIVLNLKVLLVFIYFSIPLFNFTWFIIDIVVSFPF